MSNSAGGIRPYCPMSGPRHSSTLPIVLFVVPPKSSSTTEQRQIVDIRKCRAGCDRSTNVNMLDNTMLASQALHNRNMRARFCITLSGTPIGFSNSCLL
ncbi:hypothetical protein DdX_09575 [Ditylenchus destructor]|uniref:Uncharacterized protein n=1 Tax=Ditylenchus destructor TaxID=166010 RepID=A0AAD4N3H8_9BILA|nr:hypothetical protein DdX_09575 [Ditylenchus destructor]